MFTHNILHFCAVTFLLCYVFRRNETTVSIKVTPCTSSFELKHLNLPRLVSCGRGFRYNIRCRSGNHMRWIRKCSGDRYHDYLRRASKWPRWHSLRCNHASTCSRNRHHDDLRLDLLWTWCGSWHCYHATAILHWKSRRSTNRERIHGVTRIDSIHHLWLLKKMCLVINRH